MALLRFLFVCCLALSLAPPCAMAQGAKEPEKSDIQGNIVIILDASGSMWGQVGGGTKIAIAKKTLTELIINLPDNVAAGLVAYGHRKKGDCQDVEEIVPLAPVDRKRLTQAVKALTPKGMTPITESLRKTAQGLRGVEQETTILLVSDGKETCEGDPCSLVTTLKESGIKFVVDVIGFDVTDAERQQLECIAKNSGGVYYSAQNAEQFRQAVVRTSKKKSLSAGKLHIVTTRNGKEIPAKVEITDKESGKRVVLHWSVTGLGLTRMLKPGEYVLKVTDDKATNKPSQSLDIAMESGATLEKAVDFNSGVIHLATTLNKKPFEAYIEVYPSGEERPGKRVLATFNDNNAHVAKLILPAGVYDIHVKSRKTRDQPVRKIERVTVVSGRERDMLAAFESGDLQVSATLNGREVKAEAKLLNNETQSALWFEKCLPGKPATFQLTPGVYAVEVQWRDDQGGRKSAKVKNIAVSAGQTTSRKVEIVTNKEN